MRVIATFVYRHEAEFAAGYLHSEGIRAIVRADDAGGLHPGLGFVRAARLLVRDEDAADALGVLRDAGILTGGGAADDAGEADGEDGADFATDDFDLDDEFNGEAAGEEDAAEEDEDDVFGGGWQPGG
jgi:hypothetical protein